MLIQDLKSIPVLIANGTAISAAVNIGPMTLVGIIMDPSAWTPADLTFQAAPDGATFGELVETDLAAADAVAALQVHSPAAGQFIVLDPAKLRGVVSLKVRSGTSGSPVNQLADRNLTLLARSIF